jgi:hypothetical protein
MNATTINFPIYWTPGGMPRPEHIKHFGGIELADGIGPNDATDEEKQGSHLYGIDGWTNLTLPYWRKTRSGYWLAFGDSTPASLSRTELYDGDFIRGCLESHMWLVPKLLKYRENFGFVSVCEHYLTPEGFLPPKNLRDIIARLRECIDNIPISEDLIPLFPCEKNINLAIDILKLNYHVSREDMEIAEWITDKILMNVLLSACSQ